MASARTTRRRLGASVATVLAVTVGAGVLASPGAVAVPVAAAQAGATAAVTGANLPLDAEIVSTGDAGYLTSRKDDVGNPVLEWHKYADGSVLPINTGTVGHGSNSDIVVTSDGGTTVYLRDMGEGGTLSASFDLEAEFKPGAKLVGVVGANLFVRVPTGNQDYHELWQLTPVDGLARKTLRSGGPYGLDFKVIASTSDAMLVLSSNRVFPSPATRQTEYWMTRRNVNPDSAVKEGSSAYTAPWTHASTGAYSADYESWVEYRSGVTTLRVEGQYVHRTYAMDSSMSGAVIAGITWDTLLYGVPGKAAAAGEAPSTLYARNVKSSTAAPYKLLEHFSSVAQAPDGGLLVRGATADADGLFRIWPGDDGRPTATLVADTGRVMDVRVTGSQVPTAVSLEKPGTTVPMEWTLSRANATVDVTLTHTATGRKLTKRLSQPVSDSRFAFVWDGVLDGISAPNGAYTWQITATPTDGGGPATTSGSFTVSRQANPHDFNDNGSTDVLARDVSGVLWRDDLFDWPSGSQVTTAKRTKVGTGWQIYNQIEAAGNLAGVPAGDLVARDTSGTLWMYLGKGDGPFATRVKVGSGWQIYNKITGGSDLNGDKRPDLLATDTSGVLWLYKGTGSSSAPFATRVKVGSGWQIYNQITAVGNIAGSTAGDLVARDTSGVLWLYQGNGTGNFTARVKVGSGWNRFSHLVGAGDLTGDGRPDLIGYGRDGTFVYRSTGSTTAPFSRQTTTLYSGEGTKFNNIA
ncbi:VCBS repeat-containing protein [Streptomyces sp. ISL-99]|uniref:FG-GAP repeat domain-containing protein n=1 Tax=Streptomyces sp. ISL-99 TaxID=2819193 RepID=UPI001BEAEFED|nr:VCBS repeat-containing protein [Streptomyces sp. ISL-99]MBT2525386.1 VCBS repeat-containing protein [Streptomyces sp. ISL-99]